ncbi:MAG TPA: DUF1549 domain-containing protein, partial [Planctomycetaceae bacterium]|nr:DUF1549 domain-containing protein [Planctomycetaceae bacterium]
MNSSPVDLTDPELEQLLGDAYPVPNIPRSLLKRLDCVIENDWGHSPELAVTPWGKIARSFSQNASRVKTIPAIVISAMLLFAVVIFSLGSSDAAWAEMLEALKRQNVVQIQIPGGTRSMSLSEGIIIEQREESSALWNIPQNLFLTRQAGQIQMQQGSFKAASSLSPQEQLVLSFLAGPELLQEISTLRVKSERSKTVKTAGGTESALVLLLENEAGENWELHLTFDPQTRLPEAVEVHRDKSDLQSIALSYPPTSFRSIQDQQFPDSLISVAIAASSQPDGSGQEIALNQADPNEARLASAAVSLPLRPEPTVPWQSPDAVPSRWNSVEVQRLTPEKLISQIDSLLVDLWKEKGIEPTVAASETELLRRVYLDLTGRTPTVHEVRTYLDAPQEHRYEQLVVRLLNSPDHASHLATVWRKVLIPEGIDLTAFGGVQEFDRWLADQFASRKPYDEIVSSLLLAEGRLSKSGPLLFYTALKLDPDQIAARTARVFLGMRLECAECHDHPFEPWTQKDFWGYAAFFAQISRPRGELERASKLMRVHDVGIGEVMLPDSGEVILPKFLDGTRQDAYGEGTSRRVQFVRWLTDPANPYFARATANRIWGQMFGKGITDPIDNFGVQHKPRIPEIIDLLAGHLIASDFQLSEVLRAVVLSQAYRLSSGAETADPQRLDWFAQMQVKMLTAEQIYDCISVATLLDYGNAQAGGQFNLSRFSNPAREEFLQQFSTPSG